MTDYTVHEPAYSATTTDAWDAPQENDFGTDDLSEIDDHYLLSTAGFPPENFTDLQLPVVSPAGALNLNALETAHGGGHSVEAIDDINDDTAQEVKEIIETLASEEFGHEIAE